MLYFRKLPRAKKFGQEGGGVSRFSVENFLSHSAELFCRRGGVSRFSVKKFLFHSAEKLRTRTLLCFTNLGYRKVLSFRGLCHDFLSNIFV